MNSKASSAHHSVISKPANELIGSNVFEELSAPVPNRVPNWGRRLRSLPSSRQRQAKDELGEFDVEVTIVVEIWTRSQSIVKIARKIIIPGALAPGFDRSQVEKIFKKESDAAIKEVMALPWFKETEN